MAGSIHPYGKQFELALPYPRYGSILLGAGAGAIARPGDNTDRRQTRATAFPLNGIDSVRIFSCDSFTAIDNRITGYAPADF